MKKNLLLTASLAFAISAFAQDIQGSWSGVLDLGIMNLRVVFHIEKTADGYSTTMDSPDQGAKGIPTTSTIFEKQQLKIQMVDMGISFEGLLQNDTVKGMFSQMGYTFPLLLTRGEIAAVIRPQDPVPPYPYNTEDVRFENEEAGITLAGTLSWPKEGKNFPIAILVTGSGRQNRNEEVVGHRPFLVLSDYLTRNGIAVLRYDDRGVAESGGDYATATLYDFSTDAAATVKYVKTRREIDTKKIGIIGHSVGGTIAFMLAGADNSDLAYIVSMAGMAIPGDTLLRMQRYLIANASGVSDEDIAKNEALVVRIYNIIDNYSEDYILQNIATIADEILPDSLKGNKEAGVAVEQEIKLMMSPEFISIRDYNPTGVLAKIKCPVLALNGEKDLQVPADANLNRIKALVKSPVTIKKYPNLNHLLQHCTTGLPVEYGTIEETISPEVLNNIATWIKQL